MDPNTVISIVVPLKESSDLLETVVSEINQTMESSYRFFEIILVDDGSTDQTMIRAKALLKQFQRIRYLKLSRSFGRDIALSAGIESSIGDYVVTLDPRTDPIGIIPSMIETCRRSGAIVHGMDQNPLRRSILRDSFGRLFRTYCQSHIGVEIKRGVSDFRVMSRQSVNALLQVREQSRYLRVLTLTLGSQHEFVPYERVTRYGPPPSSAWHADLSQGIDLLAANTRHPLRMVTAVGLLGAILNLVYALYVVVTYFVKANIAEGWTTLSLQFSGMFFFVCLILAVLSEYVGTILGEVRSRPLYFVSEEANSSVLLEDTVQSSIVKDSVE